MTGLNETPNVRRTCTRVRRTCTRTARRALAVALTAAALAACGTGTGGGDSGDLSAADVATYCADVRAASDAPYSQATFETLQRDFPYLPGEDGYTAGNAAANAYAEDLGRPGEPSVDFLMRASVYLEGWCGGAS